VRVTAAGVWVVYVGWGLGLVCVLCVVILLFFCELLVLFLSNFILAVSARKGKEKEIIASAIDSPHSCESECEEKERK
jgi:hypothetical protein